MQPRPRRSEITDALTRILAQMDEADAARFVSEASRRVLARIEWPDD